MREVEDVSVTEQVYGNFQIPRNHGRTEMCNWCVQGPFSSAHARTRLHPIYINVVLLYGEPQ